MFHISVKAYYYSWFLAMTSFVDFYTFFLLPLFLLFYCFATVFAVLLFSFLTRGSMCRNLMHFEEAMELNELARLQKHDTLAYRVHFGSTKVTETQTVWQCRPATSWSSIPPSSPGHESHFTHPFSFLLFCLDFVLNFMNVIFFNNYT